ncbi:Potassium voltage-gated channel subfamily H member 6 [Durusdinium trenchii]|uniref:Potassium voltage-gated channel subfamily H member 6 n=1 Tax=Durusdinium trenchii TaxID=1381693 RepID=A0ABP0IG44_9DINO
MYFVRSGELGYNFDHTPHLTDEIDPGSRISEPALWMQWHYRGRLACTAQKLGAGESHSSLEERTWEAVLKEERIITTRLIRALCIGARCLQGRE